MKKLAIYYGYLSCVNQHWNDLESQLAAFSGFDIVIFGSGLEERSHPDHQNAVEIIKNLGAVDSIGYLSLDTRMQNKSYIEIASSIESWKSTGAKGIFFDCLESGHGTTAKRIIESAQAADKSGLSVVYNTNFNYFSRLRPVLEECIRPSDAILIEPFGFGDSQKYAVPAELPAEMEQMKKEQVLIYGVSTYRKGLSSDKLADFFSKYRRLADRIGLDAFCFTESSYSSADCQLVNFFDKFRR